MTPAEKAKQDKISRIAVWIGQNETTLRTRGDTMEGVAKFISEAIGFKVDKKLLKEVRTSAGINWLGRRANVAPAVVAAPPPPPAPIPVVAPVPPLSAVTPPPPDKGNCVLGAVDVDGVMCARVRITVTDPVTKLGVVCVFVSRFPVESLVNGISNGVINRHERERAGLAQYVADRLHPTGYAPLTAKMAQCVLYEDARKWLHNERKRAAQTAAPDDAE